MSKRFKVISILFVIFLLITAVGGGILTTCYSSQVDRDSTSKIASSKGRITSDVNAVADAVEKIGPSVVFINTESLEQVSRVPNPFSQDPFFRQFFGRQPDLFRRRKGQGSGVIIDPNGYILTNQHVVGGAKKITVTLTDGRKFPGTLVGSDSVTDIALVKIEADNLPVAELGDSEKVRVGEWVIAVGNPFGYENTVTVGVLSGRGRKLADVTRQYEGLIQTDAAINPGNSGGPLCDLHGRVIGINTAIIPYGQGIGFAIPIKAAKEITDILMKDGSVERAYLGIVMIDISDMDKDSLHQLRYDGKDGVIVTRVFPDSPARAAGLGPGDVIISVDGQKMTGGEQMRKYILGCTIDKDISIVIMREGVRNNLTATLKKRPDDMNLRR